MKNLLVSFSGGETSAYMIDFIHKNIEYDQIEYIFANTGLEHEKTLEFVQKVADYHQIKVHWIESVPTKDKRVSCGYKIVDFETASRNGEPFEQIITKYGIPNMNFPHCSRALKTEPMTNFIKKHLGWKDYEAAIGIRADEWDRASTSAIKRKLIYPLIHDVTKEIINDYWNKMPFRLEIPSYLGNCVGCWKKTDRKLVQIAIEEPNAFDFFKRMELMYENFIPVSQTNSRVTPIRFYRGHRAALDFTDNIKSTHQCPLDERLKGLETLPLIDLINSCSDSCEAF